jgi:hypothetical protein
MNSDRIKEIQETTAYPESVSVKQALLQVWNECAQEQVKNLNISVVSNRYAVRDWMVSEVFEFDNYNDAKRKYDEIYNETKNAECDIQLYQILHDFNNVG